VLALVAALAIGFATWYAVQQRQVVEREALARVGLYARVIEEQASRSISSAAQLLRSLSARGTVRRAETDANAADRLLDQQLPGQPHLRSVAIIDETGRVLVSTNDADTGHQINLDALGRASADAEGQSIGPVLPIRNLADLGSAAGSSAATALPLLRRVPMEGKLAPQWLVALVNPDFFATQHALISSGSRVKVLMSDLRGRVISATGDAAPNARGIETLPPFTRFLPQREHGDYIGAGSDGAAAVAAFRVSRQWPLVIVAEEPLHEVSGVWRTRAAGAASIAAGVIALLAALGWAIDHSLRREQAALLRTNRLNRELAETEQRWKLALDGAGHVVWDMDLDSGQITVSPRVGELLGYGADDLRWTVARLRESTHPEDLERTTRIIERHMRGELQHYEDELRLRTRSGPWKWVLSRAAMVGGKGSGGQRPRLIGTMTDIDMRKAAETALRESEARQQAILNSALDGIVIVDEKGHVLQFNPAAEAMFGRRQADAAGQPMHELIVPPHHRQAHQDGMARYLATGQGPVLNRRIEIEAMRADGSLFPIELTIVPVKSETGEIFTATVRDITERQRVEGALRDSEARARATFEQAAVGVMQQAADGRLLRVNQTLCTLLGHTREDLVALHVERLTHPDDLPQAQAGMTDLFAGRIPSFAQDLRLRAKDGRYLWVRLTASVSRNEEGRALNVIGIVEDIGARRRAEADLAAARQRELQVGARIQRSLLVTPPPADIDGVHFSSYSQASQGIDGDFVEIIRVGPHCVDLIAGDVMGKGLAAAMMGAATKLQFSRSMAELLTQRGADLALPEPADVVAAVHRAMTPALQELEAFVTLCYLRIDAQAGRITWVGCGHEETLLVPAAGAVALLDNQHPPLGVLDAADYRQESCALAPGDALFLCSDGVTDAMRPDGERVGRERVIEAVARRLREHPSPSAVLHALRSELLPEGVRMQDDVTMVVVQRQAAGLHTARVELPLQLRALRQVRGFVVAQASSAGLDEGACGLLEVACVEAFTNIVRHGRGLLQGAPVELLVHRQPDALVIELVHLGEPFQPPAELAETDFGAFPEGGFGLQIIQSASDGVQYLHHAGVNTMRMTKRLR
jgi:PAS domain S-box-containing protein